RDWLAAEAVEQGHGHHAHDDHAHHHDHDHHHHDHDVTRHSEDIRSFSLVIDQPISRFAFTVAMQLLTANQGEDLLRVKGIVKLAEDPERPVVIHGVQHILHDPVHLDAWPDDDHRTRLVFITRNIPRETIEGFFKAWAQASA
ncbi:MAG TPA: GTP-binding protein, partial [Pedomonas sp.]|nr:GTP-binding protein [Pedomonas sp.]